MRRYQWVSPWKVLNSICRSKHSTNDSCSLSCCYYCYQYLLRGVSISTKYSAFIHHGLKTSWLCLSINKFAIIFLCALVHSVCICFIINSQSNDCPYFCSPIGRSRKWLWLTGDLHIQRRPSSVKCTEALPWFVKRSDSYAKYFAETQESQAKEYTNEKDKWFQRKGHLEHFLKNHFLNTMTWDQYASAHFIEHDYFPKW